MSFRIVVLALALASAAPALAGTASSPDPMAKVADVGGGPSGGQGGRGAMKACRADRETYCAGVEKGGGRIVQCMKQHAAELTPGCKQALQSMRAARKGGR